MNPTTAERRPKTSDLPPVPIEPAPASVAAPASVPAAHLLPSSAPVPGTRTWTIHCSKYRIDLVKAGIVKPAQLVTSEEFQKLRDFESEAARLIDLATKSSPRTVIDQHKARRADLIAEGMEESTFPANAHGPHGPPLTEKLKLAADRKEIIFNALRELQAEFLPLCMTVLKKAASVARIELDRMLKADRMLHDRFEIPYEVESDPVRALATTIDSIESRSKSVIIGGWYGPNTLLENVLDL